MDRQTQAREMRKLAAAPDYTIGSVQAVTEHGQLVVPSASGSQIGPYAAGADQLILIIGSQKLVPDMQTALQRVTGSGTRSAPAGYGWRGASLVPGTRAGRDPSLPELLPLAAYVGVMR